jgi:penicillin-binding protein 2
MSIGQGYTLVTPLQLADVVSMVVNDGVIYKPHILKEIRDPASGAIEKSVQPEVLHKSDVDKAVFQQVRDNMRAVVTEGTARYPMGIRTVEAAGKTGTGEVGLTDSWHDWFVCFAPYRTNNPEERVAVVVSIEASNVYQWWAVYAATLMLQGIFADQTYEEALTTLGFQNIARPVGRQE